MSATVEHFRLEVADLAVNVEQQTHRTLEFVHFAICVKIGRKLKKKVSCCLVHGIYHHVSRKAFMGVYAVER